MSIVYIAVKIIATQINLCIKQNLITALQLSPDVTNESSTQSRDAIIIVNDCEAVE